MGLALLHRDCRGTSAEESSDQATPTVCRDSNQPGDLRVSFSGKL